MTAEEFIAEWHSPSPLMLVHTSGSTGKPKPLWVEKRRMVASARATCRFLGLKQDDTALLCMSLDYIAGKMMAVRAEVCGMQLIEVTPSAHPLATLDKAPTFAAMVPMQVFETLKVDRERELLRQTHHLIIGGGAVDEALAEELRTFPNAVWSTYGMTETLSHIAMRRMNGPTASDWYEPMEGVETDINEEGCLVVHAPAVCACDIVTNDRATMAEDGRSFRIIGRKDNVICSGGIKIQAEEVERKLRTYIETPFAITKVADRKFGEAVTMLIEGSPDMERICAICKQELPHYWLPRHYFAVEQLPMTDTGKPARQRMEKIALALLDETRKV
jgi:o-succinylbenzoate---CoA ligase